MKFQYVDLGKLENIQIEQFSPIVKIISYTLTGISVAIAIVLLILFWSRRNHQPLKSRSPTLILLNVANNTLFCIVLSLRFALNDFNCVLFNLVMLTLPPGKLKFLKSKLPLF